MVRGKIFALDLGSRLGYAFGAPGGGIPVSGTRQIKTVGELAGTGGGNLMHWLNGLWSKDRPALVVKEAPFSLAAFKEANSSQASVYLTYGLHVVVESMCNRFGVHCKDVHAATVRKHFIGRQGTGTREGTKDAVIRRAQLLKYLPKHCYDAYRADALAIWDWAAAALGRIGGELYLYGENAA